MTMAAWAFTSAFVLALALTGGIRALAMHHRLLDVPNERSAHEAPMPVGGGAAVVAVVCGWLLLVPLGDGIGIDSSVIVALAGLAVAFVGFVDDSRGVSKWRRLIVHASAVVLLVAGTHELGPLAVPGLTARPAFGLVVAAFGLMWLVNLFNFMDGIDGLAAMEAVFVSLALAVCVYCGPVPDPKVIALSLATGGASLGFLAWNWPPARIFMGDVGSGFLGFLLGALALIAHRAAGLSLWVPAILLAVFVTDATVTLLRRMARRERWYESHRLHGYQWLSRRFGAHQPVTLIALAVNVVWLLPLALWAGRRPDAAGLIALLAYGPVIIGVLIAGAGRPEPSGA
jgi:Fuc2NAc and GlcNAc transferase